MLQLMLNNSRETCQVQELNCEAKLLCNFHLYPYLHSTFEILEKRLMTEQKHARASDMKFYWKRTYQTKQNKRI